MFTLRAGAIMSGMLSALQSLVIRKSKPHQMLLTLISELVHLRHSNFDEEEASIQAASIPPSIKRCLKFESPSVTKVATKSSFSSDSSVIETTLPEEIQSGTTSVHKRLLDDLREDDLDLYLNEDAAENRKKRRKLPIPLVGIGTRDSTLELEAHEADLSLIERITEIRKSLHVSEFQESAPSTADEKWARHVAHIHRHIPDGAFQAITTETGERFYLNKIEDEEWDRQVTSLAAVQKSARFLNIPYSVLRARAENEQIRQDARRAAQMQEAEDSGMESGVEDEDDTNKESLWVEKFKPKHYFDLLSDESTNRTVLHWMKLWDKLVFGIDKKPKKKEEKKKDFPDKPFNKFPKKTGTEVVDELDEKNRPQQKVILLCGPPGLGKTTLAHIIACHAGYNVVEMNASDDRSVDTFRTNLENATSMKSVLGPAPRPNCLIIDEIDGAPAPSINLLINMLNGKETGGKGKKGKKKEGPLFLQRPVICICNELYTPALRPLRQMALVIQFPPTPTSRLAHRLLEISRKRQLKADLTVLMALCDKTENDIRSCLSVLQFVRSTKKSLSLKDIDGASVGQKDYQRSLFNVWHQIFSIPRPKRKRRANPHELQHNDGVLIAMPEINEDIENFGEQTSTAFRFQNILKTTQSCGEYDRLTQGWFENFPSIKFKHTNMDPVSMGLEWATFTDLMQKEIMHSQSWTMMAFLPYACVSYHLLFASHHWPKIQYPNQMHETNQKLLKNKNLQTAMVNEMSPLTRVFAGGSSLVQDILPHLLYIIQPTLRPVNTQLYSKQEKEDLAGLINTMISYNLTYTQERSLDGQYSFILDPNMEDVVRFPDLKPSKQLSYPIRQLISREIELEKVRRAETYFVNQKLNEEARFSAKRHAIEKQISSKKSTKDLSEANTASKSSVPNHLQKLQPKPITETFSIKAPKDFFGRIISRPVDQQIKDSTNEIVKSDIWFRFKEGYSNAVRKPIKMSDLA
ncbi:chromosome transmission fidelity protein 18 homolog isoform X3 [Procambarus clarkii]|uniref:chromosome transmission fidelity protein 18 homolog isoform X3 n=1 Tax=Procambarus clarkii TaxID=6728 RepID=UPI003741F085